MNRFDKIKAGAMAIRASQIKRAVKANRAFLPCKWDDCTVEERTDLHEDAKACIEAFEKEQ